MKTLQYVESIDKLYDEEAKMKSIDMNKRKFCIFHKWINASLRWERQLNDGFTSINFESEKSMFSRSWGKGYGGIRFCSRCKVIDCIHDFDSINEYRIGDLKHYTAYYVKYCRICGRKILTGSCEVFTEPNKIQEKFYEMPVKI